MDSTTFKHKYMPYHQKMFRIAYHLTGDDSDAQDLVQEAYIKMWNKRNELSVVDNEEAYCITLLRNLCFDFLRNKKYYTIDVNNEVQIVDNCHIVEHYEEKEKLNCIEKIINQLPLQQQQVIRLRHFDEYSSEEIEQIMNLSSVNVRVLLSRARKRIKELFNNQYGDEKTGN